MRNFYKSTEGSPLPVWIRVFLRTSMFFDRCYLFWWLRIKCLFFAATLEQTVSQFTVNTNRIINSIYNIQVNWMFSVAAIQNMVMSSIGSWMFIQIILQAKKMNESGIELVVVGSDSNGHEAHWKIACKFMRAKCKRLYKCLLHAILLSPSPSPLASSFICLTLWESFVFHLNLISN